MAGKRGPSVKIRRSRSLTARGQDLGAEHLEHGPQGQLGRQVGELRQLLQSRDHREDGLAHHLLEQVLLVLEVEVNGALGDARLLGHVVELGGGKALGGEHVERRLQDRLPPRLRVAPAQLAALGHPPLLAAASPAASLPAFRFSCGPRLPPPARFLCRLEQAARPHSAFDLYIRLTRQSNQIRETAKGSPAACGPGGCRAYPRPARPRLNFARRLAAAVLSTRAGTARRPGASRPRAL